MLANPLARIGVLAASVRSAGGALSQLSLSRRTMANRSMAAISAFSLPLFCAPSIAATFISKLCTSASVGSARSNVRQAASLEVCGWATM